MSIPTYLQPQFRNKDQPSDAVSVPRVTCYRVIVSMLTIQAILTFNVLAVRQRFRASISPTKPRLKPGPRPRDLAAPVSRRFP